MTEGATLRVIMERKGVSLRRVAGLAEISTAQVHNAMHDKDITARTLKSIVTEGLEMPMSEFWDFLERETAREERKSRKAAA